MVLKIFHVPKARSTRPVWLYYELEELYGPGHLPELELVFVDMNKFRTEKSAEYLSKNPNGKVPLLVDTDRDVTVWESGAIVNYLLDLGPILLNFYHSL